MEKLISNIRDKNMKYYYLMISYINMNQWKNGQRTLSGNA